MEILFNGSIKVTANRWWSSGLSSNSYSGYKVNNDLVISIGYIINKIKRK